jgi:hypothetical protein
MRHLGIFLICLIRIHPSLYPESQSGSAGAYFFSTLRRLFEVDVVALQKTMNLSQFSKQ